MKKVMKMNPSLFTVENNFPMTEAPTQEQVDGLDPTYRSYFVQWNRCGLMTGEEAVEAVITHLTRSARGISASLQEILKTGFWKIVDKWYHRDMFDSFGAWWLRYPVWPE